jgi:hypothetical protein
LYAANAEMSLGQVTDLAKSSPGPTTGASDALYVYNVKPRDCYPDVTFACAWQITLSPT